MRLALDCVFTLHSADGGEVAHVPARGMRHGMAQQDPITSPVDTAESHDDAPGLPPSSATDKPWLRIRGLFRRWEFEQVLEPGVEIQLDEAGKTADGIELFAIYSRPLVHVERAA